MPLSLSSFRRHGKVVIPATACTLIKKDNISAIVQHIKSLIDNRQGIDGLLSITIKESG
jgi:hypothetical protein